MYTTSIVDFGGNWEPLYHASFRIENDEGAWQEELNLTLEYPDGSASSRTSALVGEGAYAGMTAIAEITYIPPGHFDVRGPIIHDPIPDAPVHVTVDSQPGSGKALRPTGLRGLRVDDPYRRPPVCRTDPGRDTDGVTERHTL